MTYEFHPLANLFPLIEGPEFEALVADIKANGVREPVILHEGKILDGRNRCRAAQAAGMEVRVKELDGSDPLAFVISLNLHRRHLNESQRAMVAAKVANMPNGGAIYRSANLQSEPQTTQAQAADMLNVSTRTVAAAVKVRDEAEPELVAAVEQGKIAVSQAAQIASRPADEQRAIVDRVEAGEKPVAAVRAGLLD